MLFKDIPASTGNGSNFFTQKLVKKRKCCSQKLTIFAFDFKSNADQFSETFFN